MNAQRSKHSEAPVVVKVGSESADFDSPRGREKLARLAFEISYLMTSTRRRVVLVSSGAVAQGRKAKNLSKERELSLEERRALASIGQHRLMSNWESLFASCTPPVLV